ncbi:Cyclic di-GMP phosphodiesterase Gmr [Pelagimonas phthalicica]|uniref:Cyclic di-GMP phosphodiesterase Gmr n=1 Tax=Pelagimonas phthalicica TaxID=1037362 RepID=A0A238JLF0_9RHOB|nr:EAL domain-containing protein [Pelagimonas phthalicica]TDS87034.1 diguanylate cyclase (GGDEF)-like protein [Pelagimonas phthalicica]SMX30616.1 Cyclic di-GMP phosphodiesterase Gmr [Pelagimonas phthalicica]
MAKLSNSISKSPTRPLRVRLQALILFAVIPSAVGILYFGIEKYNAEVARYSDDARRITAQLAEKQQALIIETQSFLKKLALSEAVQDPMAPQCGVFLAQVLQLSDKYENLGVPRWDGELHCSALPLITDVNVKDRPYFRKAIDKKDFAVGTFQTDRVTNHVSVNFSYPVIPEGQRDPIGAAVAVLGLEWWSASLERADVTKDAVATITDASGRIVAIFPPDPEMLGQDHRQLGVLGRQADRGNPDLVRGTDGRLRVLTQRVLFEDGDGLPVTVTLGFPLDAALASARQTTVIRLAGLLGLVALINAMAFRLLERQVLRPMEALTRTIERFEAGFGENLTLEQQAAKIKDFETISGSFRRISKARQTAEEMESERRQQMQALLDALPDTYFRLSRDGVILDYRASDKEDLLMPPEQFLGRKVSDVLGGSALEFYELNMAQFLKDRKPRTWEYDLEIRGRKTDFEARLRDVSSRDEAVLVVRNISELKRAREKILLQARTDFLTRLPNRASLTLEVENAVSLSRQLDRPLVLMFVDLDGLKKVNDKLGHAIGDGLLKLVAQRLRSAIQSVDFVARHAGDEFVVLLRGEEAVLRTEPVARRILEAMHHPFNIGQDCVQISASIGIAHCPDDAVTPQSLLSAADQAMYSAKAAGGGCIRHFTHEIGSKNAHRLRMLDDLHRALEFDEFELFYQPIIDLKTGRIVMAEALLRWNHPEFGLLTPDRFLHFVEEAGLMIEVGDVGLRNACSDLGDFVDRFGPGFKVCVNHSPKELCAREHGKGLNWPDYIRANAPATGAIVVEITEAALLDPTPFTLATLRSFRAAGVEVALDDFGAGYSSLLYFLNNEFDYLKIDREFAQNAPESARAAGLCETILGLSARLGSKAIAEGIERKEQLVFFQNRGCALGQGFLFSKALSREAFLSLSEKRLLCDDLQGGVLGKLEA